MTEGDGTVGERLVERLSITQAMLDENEKLRGEIAQLREAIRRLAEQDATLSVQGGSVTVTMDATLTDSERAAIKTVIGGFGMWVAQNGLTHNESLRLAVVTLRKLLERLHT